MLSIIQTTLLPVKEKHGTVAGQYRSSGEIVFAAPQRQEGVSHGPRLRAPAASREAGD